MKFSDIDFSAIKHMMDAMSDEEKEKLNEMADSMLNNMNNPFQASKPVQPQEQETDFYSQLHLDEARYGTLPWLSLDALESAAELEDFYSEDEDPDLSAPALLYVKALLFVLRQKLADVYGKHISGKPLAASTLLDFYTALSADGNGALAARLMPAVVALNQAEYDRISRAGLDRLKEVLFDENLLLDLNENNRA